MIGVFDSGMGGFFALGELRRLLNRADIVFLADKIEECKLPCILTIDGSDKTIAESIQKNVDGDVAIKELNSLQSVSEAQITEGITYLSVMEQNLEVIKEALQ